MRDLPAPEPHLNPYLKKDKNEEKAEIKPLAQPQKQNYFIPQKSILKGRLLMGPEW